MMRWLVMSVALSSNVAASRRLNRRGPGMRFCRYRQRTRIATRLQAAGIETFLPDESLMQVIGWNLNTYGYVRVQIAPKDYDAAKDLLTEIDQDA
jgi:putative signal transducing protein